MYSSSLFDIYFGIVSDMYSGILPGKYSDILFDIYFNIRSGSLSGLTFDLTYILAVCLAYYSDILSGR